MLQPEHLRPFQAVHSTRRRAVSLGFVALFHVFVIYAFASGLANHLVEKLPEEIKAEVVKEQIPVKPPPPPPPPDLAKPPPPYVPPPDIVIQSEAPATNAITVQHTVQTVAPPPKPSISAPALIMGQGANCASSYYPPVAQRLEQEGTTTVAVHITAEGGIQSVEVTNSSGHDSLDQAAIKCITEKWHFRPAIQDGQPVPFTRQYAVKWQLQ